MNKKHFKTIGRDNMIGNKYKVKKDCQTGRIRLKQGDVLTEKGVYNFDTEEYEDGKEYNDLFKESLSEIPLASARG